jgi:hypothetical protein
VNACKGSRRLVVVGSCLVPPWVESSESPRVLALLRARGARQICARSALRAPFRADGGPNAVQRRGAIGVLPTVALLAVAADT